MSNLLPEKAQQNLRSEYRARFILAGASLAIGGALFTVLALSPSYMALFVTRPAAQAKATALQESKQDSSDIARAQSLMFQLAPVASASSTASSAILQALRDKPNGVRIYKISYSTDPAGSIAVAGIADSRQAMDQYRTALQADSLFTSVKFSVQDLIAGATGGRFSITLAGNF
jgi:Tfp pilus assembly protein PilN